MRSGLLRLLSAAATCVLAAAGPTPALPPPDRRWSPRPSATPPWSEPCRAVSGGRGHAGPRSLDRRTRRPRGVALRQHLVHCGGRRPQRLRVRRTAQHVRVFDSAGAYVETLGRPGRRSGRVQRAEAIAMLSDGRLVVRDPGNQRLESSLPGPGRRNNGGTAWAACIRRLHCTPMRTAAPFSAPATIPGTASPCTSSCSDRKESKPTRSRFHRAPMSPRSWRRSKEVSRQVTPCPSVRAVVDGPPQRPSSHRFLRRLPDRPPAGRRRAQSRAGRRSRSGARRGTRI